MSDISVRSPAAAGLAGKLRSAYGARTDLAVTAKAKNAVRVLNAAMRSQTIALRNSAKERSAPCPAAALQVHYSKPPQKFTTDGINEFSALLLSAVSTYDGLVSAAEAAWFTAAIDLSERSRLIHNFAGRILATAKRLANSQTEVAK